MTLAEIINLFTTTAAAILAAQGKPEYANIAAGLQEILKTISEAHGKLVALAAKGSLSDQDMADATARFTETYAATAAAWPFFLPLQVAGVDPMSVDPYGVRWPQDPRQLGGGIPYAQNDRVWRLSDDSWLVVRFSIGIALPKGSTDTGPFSA